MLRRNDPFRHATVGLNPEINPYVKILEDPGCPLPVLTGGQLLGRQGRWRDLFADSIGAVPKRLVVEVGCHMGHTLKQLGQSAPEVAFVGIDITYKRVVKTGRRIASMPNARCLLSRGEHLSALFGPGEISGMVIFFPDPWAKKKRQRKHRLINPSFCRSLTALLEPGGFFWLRTDCEDYYREASGFLSEALPICPVKKPDLINEDVTSTFYKLFTSRGLRTFEGVWVKG